jgi:choline transport protein
MANKPLLPSQFDLGKWGLSINIISMVFLIFFLIAAFFPAQPNPTADTMNYAILLYGLTVVGSMIYYVLYGRHKYAGPVEYVRKLD